MRSGLRVRGWASLQDTFARSPVAGSIPSAGATAIMQETKTIQLTMEKKYELTTETVEVDGYVLHQIRALRDFGNVKAGDLGGWIENERNLSQEGNAWVYDYAVVCGNAEVSGDAWVRGDAWVYDNAKVSGDAIVCMDAEVYGNAKVSDKALVCDNAKIYGNACVCGNAEVRGNELVTK